MNWTTDKPTRAGWWWYRPDGLTMRPKQIFDYRGRLFICGQEWLDYVTTGQWSSEPLEPPKEAS